MRRGVTCGWCHTMAWSDSPTWPRCGQCGHRADLSRVLCDCPHCASRVCVPPAVEIDLDEPVPPLPPMHDGRIPCPQCNEAADVETEVTVWCCPACQHRWETRFPTNG